MDRPRDYRDQCETCDSFNDGREEFELCARGYKVFAAPCRYWMHTPIWKPERKNEADDM